MTTMRKLILLVAVATTMSFAACTNTTTTESETTEEVAIENAEVAEVAVDSAAQVVAEEAEALTETVD